MKTIVYNGPLESGTVPSVAREFQRGEEVAVTDEQAEILLNNAQFEEVKAAQRFGGGMNAPDVPATAQPSTPLADVLNQQAQPIPESPKP